MGGSPCGIVASLSRRGGSPKEFYPRARREFFAFSSRRLTVFFTSTKGARGLELPLTFAFLLRIVLQFRGGLGLSRPSKENARCFRSRNGSPGALLTPTDSPTHQA